MNFNPSDFQKMLNWSKDSFSHLPWRKRRSIYHTIVSEIMLQQTTLSTVLNKFDLFVEKFPDFAALSKASDDELLLAWKGLGYYRRAKNLKQIAIQWGEVNQLPQDYQTFKGIGPYTANAILAMGEDKRALCLDTNLQRVLSRYFAIGSIPKGPKLQQFLYGEFDSKNLLGDDSLSFRAINESLMDVGRVYCQSSTVHCLACPLSSSCEGKKQGQPLAFPLGEKKKTQKEELFLVRVLSLKGDKILAYKKVEKEWLEGQWELPTFSLKTKSHQYPLLDVDDLALLAEAKSTITKYAIQNILVAPSAEIDLSSKRYTWIPLSDWRKLSSACQKLLVKILIIP